MIIQLNTNMKTLLTIAAALFLGAQAFATDFPVVYNYDTKNQECFEVHTEVPDGNYLVTIKIGSKKKAGNTFIKAESRRLYVNDLNTAKGEFQTVQFVVNKRDAIIRQEGKKDVNVTLKSRENGKYNWDKYLNIEILGNAPVVESITIEPAPNATTIFLCGDSTVVDQDNEPWASWGQMFPWFWNTNVAIANYAESGERTDTFIGAGRLNKILSVLKPGDYVFVEFGHNDQKINNRMGGGAYYFFATQLKTFIDQVKAKGGHTVLVSPTHRRNFDQNGKIVETHLDYPEAMEWVAKREGVPFIDLHKMSAAFYEALGPEKSKTAFVHYKAGDFPGMPADVADNTHFNHYGAFELAKCVVGAMQVMGMPIAENIINFNGYNPSTPAPAEDFHWFPSPYRTMAAQVAEKDDKATEVLKK